MSFVITVKEYEKPQTGSYVGVLADVINLGIVQGKFGPKPTARLVWLLKDTDSEGSHFRVMIQATASMNEKAKLYKRVSEVLNSPVPDNYDLENLIGKCNMLMVRRSETTVNGKKKIYANIESIFPLPAGTAPFAIPQGFVRKKDQQQNGSSPAQAAPQQQAAAPVSAPVQTEVADEDIPF